MQGKKHCASGGRASSFDPAANDVRKKGERAEQDDASAIGSDDGRAFGRTGDRLGRKLLGPDHKIVVEAFDDPSVQGVACYISRAKAGGLSGAVGVAKDPSRFSVACRQVGPIRFTGPLPLQEEVFKQSASFIFRHVRVVRIVDPKRNALAYLTYSDKVIDGSPDNAITAVAVPDQKIPVR